MNFAEGEAMVINVDSSMDLDQKENNSIDANLNMSMSEQNSFIRRSSARDSDGPQNTEMSMHQQILLEPMSSDVVEI